MELKNLVVLAKSIFTLDIFPNIKGRIGAVCVIQVYFTLSLVFYEHGDEVYGLP